MMQVSIMADPPENKEAQQLVLDLSTPTSTKIPEPSEVEVTTRFVQDRTLSRASAKNAASGCWCAQIR
jgi:hypothetical protein